MSPHHSPIPTRTPFPNLEPMGLHTAYVEKLTSYLIRVASLSHVTVHALVKKYIKSVRGVNYTDMVFVRLDKRLINAHGAMARAWVSCAQRLVGRDDLHLLTLLPWSNAFTPNCQLMSPVRRWCPDCLSEDGQTHAPVYERLLWSIQHVNICPRHRCSLVARCPTCGHQHRSDFTSRQLNGFCSACGEWLGAKRPERPRPPNGAIPNDQTWAAETFADLLLTPLSENLATYRTRIVAATDILCKQAFHGDAAAFCQQLGIRTSDISAWRNARSYPNAKTLLSLSYCFRITLRDLFDGKFHSCVGRKIRPLPHMAPAKKNRLRSAREWNEIGLFLQQIIAGQRQASSLVSVASILGLRPVQLRAHFPASCIEVSRISKRFRANAREESRLMRDRLLRECISAEVQRLLRIGQQPTNRSLHAFARARQLATNTPEDMRLISEIRHTALRDAQSPRIAPRHDESKRR